MKIRRMFVRTLVLVFLIACHAGAAEFVVPVLRSAVTDQAGILSPSTRQQLESALRQLQSVGGTQLAVLTLPDLAGLTIEQASIRVVDAWKLGSNCTADGWFGRLVDGGTSLAKRQAACYNGVLQ